MEADMAEQEPQEPVMTGEGNQPEGTGYAPPDTGLGEDAESEIPVGVDEIEHEAPADDAGGDAEGGTATIDVSAIPDAEGTARDETDAPETGEAADADAGGEAEADAEGEAEADSGGDVEADAGGDEADAEGDEGPAAEGGDEAEAEAGDEAESPA
jgi:hypothetical protein